MSTEREQLPPDTNEVLQRILKAVEPAKPRHGLETACAIILALATTASAWCAYQSKLWGGAQMARANTAVKASREGAVNSLAAVQARAFDATMFITFMQARLERSSALEAFLSQLKEESTSMAEGYQRLEQILSGQEPQA